MRNPTLPSPKGRVRLEIVIAIEQGGAEAYVKPGGVYSLEVVEPHPALPKREGGLKCFRNRNRS